MNVYVAKMNGLQKYNLNKCKKVNYYKIFKKY